MKTYSLPTGPVSSVWVDALGKLGNKVEVTGVCVGENRNHHKWFKIVLWSANHFGKSFSCPICGALVEVHRHAFSMAFEIARLVHLNRSAILITDPTVSIKITGPVIPLPPSRHNQAKILCGDSGMDRHNLQESEVRAVLDQLAPQERLILTTLGRHWIVAAI